MLSQHRSGKNGPTMLYGPWLGILVATLILAIMNAQRSAKEDPRFTPPGGEESSAVRELIDKAKSMLHAGKTVNDVLSDSAFLAVRSYPRFRELIRDHASVGTVSMVPTSEPGELLQVRGMVVNSRGQPVKNALIYAYHTSAKGWYSDKAAHIAGNSGDTRHARLFVYLKTDDAGHYSFRTIRPGGYPATDLPAHIHVHIDAAGIQSYVTEIRFDDDPRLTPKWLERSKQEGCVICSVKTDADKVQQVEANFQLR